MFISCSCFTIKASLWLKSNVKQQQKENCIPSLVIRLRWSSRRSISELWGFYLLDESKSRSIGVKQNLHYTGDTKALGVETIKAWPMILWGQWYHLMWGWRGKEYDHDTGKTCCTRPTGKGESQLRATFLNFTSTHPVNSVILLCGISLLGDTLRAAEDI